MSAGLPPEGDASEAERAFAGEALDLAAQGAGRAAPNPMVGAVVVKDRRAVGRGYHVHAGRDHAEVVALREAGGQARGATLVVTLEPCSTTGRTPPCTEAILAAGIARVVACTADPNPRHAGEGFRQLRAAGIEVVAGLLRERAVRLNERFGKWITTGRPLVTCKHAVSVDGRIAAGTGESKWLTGELARRRAHELRRENDAVLVGVGTVLTDDPRLTARVPDLPPATPLRCVLDPDLRTPPTARLFAPASPGEEAGAVLLFARLGAASEPDGRRRAEALAAAGASVREVQGGGTARTRLDLAAVLEELGRARSVTGVLVEGGGVTSGHFLEAGLVDRVELHVAPLVLGAAGTRAAFATFGATTLGEAVRLEGLRASAAPPDVVLQADVAGGFDVLALARQLAALEGSR